MPDSTLSRALVLLRAVLYSIGFIALWWWLAVLVRPLDARLSFTLPVWIRPLGLAPILLGALLVLWCISTFVTRGRGTPAPFDPPREFVAVGPYRYVRNPMYIGGFGVLLGGGMVFRSPSILGLSVVYLVLLHLLVWVYEEPSLVRRFGPPYRRYKSTVYRWLPRTPRGKDKIPFAQKLIGLVLVAVLAGLGVDTVVRGPVSASLQDLFAPSPRNPSRPRSIEKPVDTTEEAPTPEQEPEPDSPVPKSTEGGFARDEEAQRQTVKDIRLVGTAMFNWHTDQIGAGAAGQVQVDLKEYYSISYRNLESILVPRYLQKIPEIDGWGNPYEFSLSSNPLAQRVMSIRSPGRDGTYSSTSYNTSSFEPLDFDEDIVWADGFFVRWPQIPK